MDKEYSENNWKWYRYNHVDEIDCQLDTDYKDALLKWAEETTDKLGHPDPYNIEDNKMVDEGAQYSVQYYNETVQQ